jgi:4-hydroxybenzoate polyprenyltransferase
MKEIVANLLKVKSIVTLVMTGALVALLLCPTINPPQEVLALYCTSYGAIITYFFTRKDGDSIANL